MCGVLGTFHNLNNSEYSIRTYYFPDTVYVAFYLIPLYYGVVIIIVPILHIRKQVWVP